MRNHVALHTHDDGHAVWSQRVNPSSTHGVSTVVLGNMVLVGSVYEGNKISVVF
jgi:N-acyl-D-aspartate/D-glutamate deacylase